MSNSQSEHLINLPLVSKSEESARLPLAINVVAKYWGEDLTPLASEPAPARGAVMIDGIELAEKRGLACYIYKSSLKDLKKRIDQGIPPIVIMPGIQDVVQHATVVSGYNSEERRILTYVPEPDTFGAVSESQFESDWIQDDMTAIVLIPQDMKGVMKNEDLKFGKSNRLCFESERPRHEGRLNLVVDMLTQATQVDPDNPQAWCLLAGVHNEMGSEQALPCYERTIKLNPQYYLAYRGLGNYFLKRKDHALAEAYYTKAIEINPVRFGPIYKNRAVTRLQIGNNAGAKQDLIRYLEQTPNAADVKAIEDAISQIGGA